MLSYCTFFLCTLLVFASSIEKETSKEQGSRILNGTKASLGQFPWQAAIFLPIDNATHVHNGVIIAPEWILTYAPGIDNALVYTGQIALNGNVGFISAGIKAFDHATNSTTLTLIKLGAPLKFDENVKPIAIGENELRAGVEVVMSGWDHSPILSKSDVLNYVYLNTISNDDCETIMNATISSEIVCTVYGMQSVNASCNEDYADPLVSNIDTTPTLVGIAENIKGCHTETPIRFTRLLPHLDWIRELTGI